MREAGSITSSTDVKAPPEDLLQAKRRGRRNTIAAAVMAGLLALAIGFAVGVFLMQSRHPGDDSPEAGFARDMSTHHSQAVEMSMLAYRQAACTDTRTLALDMGLAQQGEIGMMREWLTAWGLDQTSSQPAMAWMPPGQRNLLPDGRMPGMATRADVERLKSLTGQEFDLFFAELMTQHHLGGIHMLDGILAQTDDDEIRTTAENMKRVQQEEIGALRQLVTAIQAGSC